MSDLLAVGYRYQIQPGVTTASPSEQSIGDAKPRNSAMPFRMKARLDSIFSNLSLFSKSSSGSSPYYIDELPALTAVQLRKIKPRAVSLKIAEKKLTKLYNEGEAGSKAAYFYFLSNNIVLMLAKIDLADRYKDKEFTSKEFKRISKGLCALESKAAYNIKLANLYPLINEIQKMFFPQEEPIENKKEVKNMIASHYMDYQTISDALREVSKESSFRFTTPAQIELRDFLKYKP